MFEGLQKIKLYMYSYKMKMDRQKELTYDYEIQKVICAESYNRSGKANSNKYKSSNKPG